MNKYTLKMETYWRLCANDFNTLVNLHFLGV